MGFFDGLREGAGKSWQNDKNLAQRVGNVLGKGESFREKLGYGLGRISSPTTWGIGGVVAATVVGAGAYMAMSSRGREFREEDRAEPPPLPQMLTPQDLMMQPMPQQALSGPADGRQPNEWQMRVRPDLAAQTGVNASQPRMSITDQVTDLGSAKTTQSI